jgi:hypothetical protein
MSWTWWTWARLACGAAILAVRVWRLGTGPFLDAVRMINGWSLAAAAAIALLTTVCCAWRWSLVASLPGAVVIIAAWLHRGTRDAGRADPPRPRLPATASLEGAARG